MGRARAGMCGELLCPRIAVHYVRAPLSRARAAAHFAHARRRCRAHADAHSHACNRVAAHCARRAAAPAELRIAFSRAIVHQHKRAIVHQHTRARLRTREAAHTPTRIVRTRATRISTRKDEERVSNWTDTFSKLGITHCMRDNYCCDALTCSQMMCAATMDRLLEGELLQQALSTEN